MWEQRRNRQPMLELITPGRAVASGYKEWFYTNGKPFIMTPEACARVLRAPRPERPRQQRGLRSTGVSTHQTGGPSTSAGPRLATEGPSTKPYTPMPPVFSHASSSQLQSPMAPPTEGFFAGAFQPYNSMMTAPLHSPGSFFPPPHQLHTSVAPLSVYPLHRLDFGSSYGMVQHTPSSSLFATRPSGSGHDAHDDVDADETEEDDDEDDDALVRRNPRRNRRAPACGTEGHRRH
ncbi:hypothetical protein V6N13_140113 [Hibiscus sabdariffa]